MAMLDAAQIHVNKRVDCTAVQQPQKLGDNECRRDGADEQRADTLPARVVRPAAIDGCRPRATGATPELDPRAFERESEPMTRFFTVHVRNGGTAWWSGSRSPASRSTSRRMTALAGVQQPD